MILLGLIQNITLLVALAAGYQVMAARLKQNRVGHQVLTGLLFGGAGLVGMMTPLQFMPGIIFDGRSIILSVAAFFGGPVVAIISAGMCAMYRLWMGGAGAWVGVSVIAEASALGVLFYYHRRRRARDMSPLLLLGFGGLVHVAMMLLMLALPGGAGLEVLRKISLPVLTLYPVATMLICMLFLDYEKQLRDRDALNESEARYRSLFATNMDGVFLTAPDGRTLAANAAACRMLGYTEEELTRLGREGVMDVGDPRLRVALEERRKSGRFHGELTMIRKDGTKFPVEMSAVVFTDRGGELKSSVVIRDITERRRMDQALRDSEGYIKAVLDNLPVGVAVNSVDPSVVFNYINNIFPVIYRTTKEELTRADAFWDVVYEDPVFRDSLRKRVLEDCASGDPGRMYWPDIPITRQGLETTYITAKNIPVPGKPLMISTVWDVTDRKRAEERMKQQLDELRRWQEVTVGREERVAELKREVNRLAQQLGEKASCAE